MRYAARRDSNDAELANIARSMGATLIQEGPFDYWCGYRGVWRPVEIKNPKQRGHKDEYTPKQQDLRVALAALGLPLWVWRIPADVYRDLGCDVR
jgi:hypothetical protein